MKKILIVTMLLMLLMPFALAIPDPYDMLRGKQMIPVGGPWIADNQYIYFGDDKDSYIKYDTATGYLVLSGVAATSLTAGGTVGANNHLTCAAGSSKLDFQLGTGTTDTTTGINTLHGDVSISDGKVLAMVRAGTFATGTGAVSLLGPTTIADLAAITAGSGSAAYDLSASTGAFTTSSGANTLSGDTTISGSKNFTTGTGTTALNGNVTLAATKGFTKTAGVGDFDYSLGTGAFKTATGTNTIGGAVVFAADKGVTVNAGTGAFDFSGGSGLFKTSAGAVTIGPGATGLTGATTISNLAAITAGSGSAAYNLAASSGAFATSTGTNTLSGDTVISGSKTFTTGTGAVAINGDTTIAATKGITKTAGAGNFDFSAGSGTFKTSYGINTLSGDVSIADGKDFAMVGAGTFATGTGDVSLNGAVTIAANKDLSLSGTGDVTSAATIQGEQVTSTDDMNVTDTLYVADIVQSNDAAFTNVDITGTLDIDTPTTTIRNVTLDADKTLAVTTADKLTVGGNIIPQEMAIPFTYTASSVDVGVFSAKGAWNITAVELVPRVVGGDAGAVNVTVKVCDSGEAPASGVAALSAVLDLKGTADTTQAGSLSATVACTAAQYIALDFTGTMTDAVGSGTIWVKRV